jgi:hypothetical protein
MKWIGQRLAIVNDLQPAAQGLSSSSRSSARRCSCISRKAR